MSKRPAPDISVAKRQRLMVQPDGFAKPKSSKPVSKPAAPKFASAFDEATSTGSSKPQQPRKSNPAVLKAFETAAKTKETRVQLTSAFDGMEPSKLQQPQKTNQNEAKKPTSRNGPSKDIRALRPPVPLALGPRSSSPPPPAPARRPPPLPASAAAPSEFPAFRHLKFDPPPIPVAGPSNLKSLVPPPAPAFAAPMPPDKMRTISTTTLARHTDIFTESGPSELASLLLDRNMEVDEWDTPEELEERRGLIVSPEKASGKGGKFIRGGLAAWANSFYDRQHSARSLWEAETMHTLSSRHALNPDMRLRIKHILHVPQLSSHQNPRPDVSIPGIALCHIIAAPSAASSDPYQAALPRSKDSVCAVLFSFASVSPPRAATTASLLGTTRNAEDFAEGREVYVWRPWQTLTLDVGMLQDALDKAVAPPMDEDSPAARTRASEDIFELFGPTQARVRHREKIVGTALLCERFVIVR
ncbi:hypothetical protein HMN09_00742500 [Mycena chlorophos]|uniref:Uncharacterized protein n=1 Tax=Mycena chlorophos TaxID=658473 RepID=A0A8H6W8S7_MYCCL|nr:hypothetical protein HMN09_00742500 [Mycena chlorophos]